MIRVEREEDYYNVQNLTREAFWNLYEQGADEHFLLHNIRKSKDFIPELSLVIEEDSHIIGQITYSHSKVVYESGKVLNAITFGPVSVELSRQGKGVGSQLIKHSIEKAKNMGFKALIILGHPSYYLRFGFRCTKQANICLGDHKFYKAAMFLELQQGYLTSNSSEIGVFQESKQFEVDQEKLEQFDKKFAAKEKYKTVSQQMFQIVSQLQWNDELPPNPMDSYNRAKLE